MKKVELTMKENFKYNTIKKLVDTNGNKKTAILKLNISKRQVNRLILIYKEQGKAGFIHGNRNRKPAKAISSDVYNDIITLYCNKYQGFNYKHFMEYLKEEENIDVSYSCIYNTLMSNNCLSPRVRKKTKKRIAKEKLENEKKLLNKSKTEINELIEAEITNAEIALEDSHPRCERPKYFGELIEMDGSIHKWFGDEKSCLHLAADKCTNTIVGAYFAPQETLNGYYNVYKQILENYGIPAEFKTDNRTVFAYNLLNSDKQTSEKDVLTQFGYACKHLGTNITTTSVPQAKGLIERDNGTFQDRLISEFRLNNITTLEQANKYLINIFIHKFNKNFSLDTSKFGSVYEKSPDEKAINSTLAVLSNRIIDNGNSIKFKNNYYKPFEKGIMKCFRPKTKCLVISAFNGDLFVTIENKIYELRLLNSHKEISPNFDTIEEKNSENNKEKSIYVPPMSHHWKSRSFEEQMKNAHTKRIYS